MATWPRSIRDVATTDPPRPRTTTADAPPHEDPAERTYSGDMVLLVLFVAIAIVVGLLLFAHRQMDRSMEEGSAPTVLIG